MDPAVGCRFEEAGDDDHSELGGDLAESGGERAVERLGHSPQIGAERGQCRFGKSHQFGTGISGLAHGFGGGG